MKRIATLFLILRFVFLLTISSANNETASGSGSATDNYIPEDGKALNDNYVSNMFICVNYVYVNYIVVDTAKYFLSCEHFQLNKFGKDPILYYIMASKLIYNYT